MPSVDLIPGEMRLWTDRAAATRPAAGGTASVGLLADVLAARPGDVLVVGPHADDVMEAFAGRAVTVVVRALSDAEETAARFVDASVICGDLTDFAASADRTWDVVVALDGVERVSTNDRPSPSWADRLGLVAGLAGTEGVVLVAIDNPVSALALADARPVAERRETGDWEPPASLDSSRPGTVEAALEAVAGLGMNQTAWSVGWLVTRPGVLVSGTGDDVRIRSALGRDVAALSGHTLLFDPMPWTVARLAEGRYADVASGWVLLASRAALPASAASYGIADGVAPAGELVSDRALALTQAEDLVALRALVAGYLTWLPAQGGSVLPDSVVVDGDGFTALLAPVVTTGDPIAEGTLWLARRLLAPDVRRIWPPWLDESAVARTLGAMAGITVAPEALAAAATNFAQPVVSADVRSLAALVVQLREELVSARGEVFAHVRLATNRDRQLENRSVRLVAADRRADLAELRAQQAERNLVLRSTRLLRRALRAGRHPVKAARRVAGVIKRR